MDFLPCGFPHSDIPGSSVVRHLPRAFRSLPRPSSAFATKASPVRPLYLASLAFSFYLLRACLFYNGLPIALTRLTLLCLCICMPSLPSPQLFSVHYRDQEERRRKRSFFFSILLRKEVIQPHLPVQLPCYDLALLTRHTVVRPSSVTGLLVNPTRVA